MLSTRSFWRRQSFPLYATDGADSGNNDDGAASDDATKNDDAGHKDDLDTVDGLGDAGKEAIRRERAAAKAAADRAKTLQDERDALLKEKTDREAAERKAREKAAAEAGKFEELATAREKERDDAQQSATRLQAEVDQLKTAMEQGLDQQWAALPEKIRKLWKGDDDDVLGRFAWLHDDDVQALAKDLAGEAGTSNSNRAGPKAGGDGPRIKDDEAARLANASRYA